MAIELRVKLQGAPLDSYSMFARFCDGSPNPEISQIISRETAANRMARMLRETCPGLDVAIFHGERMIEDENGQSVNSSVSSSMDPWGQAT